MNDIGATGRTCGVDGVSAPCTIDPDFPLTTPAPSAAAAGTAAPAAGTAAPGQATMSPAAATMAPVAATSAPVLPPTAAPVAAAQTPAPVAAQTAAPVQAPIADPDDPLPGCECGSALSYLDGRLRAFYVSCFCLFSGVLVCCVALCLGFLAMVVCRFDRLARTVACIQADKTLRSVQFVGAVANLAVLAEQVLL